MTTRARWIRRLFLGIVAIIVLLAVAIALLPMLLSAGYAPNLVRSLVQDNVRGTVGLDAATLRWRGPQRISGLTIDDADGTRVLNADLTVPQGLLQLLFYRDAGIDATLSGSAQSDLQEDGTLSITRIFKERDSGEGDDGATGGDTGGRSGDALPPVRVTVDTLRLELRDRLNRRSIIVPDLGGTIAFEPGDELTIDLSGETNADGLLGTLSLSGSAVNLIAADGGLTPAGATLAFELRANMIPVLGMTQYTELQTATIALTSDDLTKRVNLRLNADAQIDYEPGSRLVADLALAEPFAASGAATIALENLSGKLMASRVPSPLIQPFLADLPIRLTRDVGPTFDADAHFNAGDVVEARFYLVGEKAELNVTADFETASNAWTGSALSLTVRDGHPELIEAYTGLTVTQPATFFIGLDSFALPGIDPATNARRRSDYAASGRIELHTPAQLALGSASNDTLPATISIDAMTIHFESPALGQYLSTRGEMVVDGGTLTFDQRLTSLIDEEGAISAATVLADGTMEFSDLPRQVLAQFAPDREVMLRELTADAVSGRIAATAQNGQQQATIAVESGPLAISMQAAESAEGLNIRDAQIEAMATPALAAMYLGAGETSIALTGEAPLTIDIEPFMLPAISPRRWTMPPEPLVAQVRSPGFGLANLPGIVEPLDIQAFASALAITMPADGPMTVSADGTTRIFRVGGGRPAAVVAFDLNAAPAGEAWTIGGETRLTELRVYPFERLLGIEPASVSSWVGEDGAVTATFSLDDGVAEATIQPALTRLTGTLTVRADRHRATITGDRVVLTATAAKLGSLLNPDKSAADPAARITVAADVPITLRIEQLGIDRAEDESGGYAIGSLVLDVDLRAEPLIIREAGAAAETRESTLRDLRILASSDRLRDGVTFSLTAKAASRSAQQIGAEGDVRITGTATNLIDATGSLSTDQARINLDAHVEQAPTIIVDALLQQNGYLLATVGPQLNATITAEDFSRESGMLHLDVVTTNGYLRARGNGRDGLLVFDDAGPIEAQLEINPLLRERVLSRLHPLLRDVVVSQQPLRATVRGATIPMDGDVSRLNAMIDLTLGEVEFDRSSPLFGVLALAQSGDPTLGGMIEPVRATISDGIVTYDRFNVRVGDIAMPYEGRIDLNTRTASLRTTLPLGAIAGRFKPNIGREISDLQVPIVTRGGLDALKTEISPDFDLARELLRSTIDSNVGDNLPIPVGNILDLLRNRNTKEPKGEGESL